MQGLNEAKKAALMELIKKLFAAESKDMPEEGMALEVETNDPEAAEDIMEGLTAAEPLEDLEEDDMSEDDARKSFFQRSRKLPPQGKTKTVAAGMPTAPKTRMMAGRR
jgi:TusA-related sulfurtransferase